MTFTSADLVGGSPFGPSDAPPPAPQPMPDDMMHDVPLQSSMAASSAPASPTVTSPRPLETPGALASAPQFAFPHRQHALTVRVHRPETASDSSLGILSTSHTVFLVETTSTLTSFPKAHCEVKRRFSDFQALYEALHHKFVGYFLPPCPEKDLMQGKIIAGKFFLSKRANSLAIFLNRCCDHALLRDSSALELFLTLCVSGTQRLAHQPVWKQAAAEEPLFRSFHTFRSLAPPPSSAPPAAPKAVQPLTAWSAVGVGVGVGRGLLKGVQLLSRTVTTSVSAVSPAETIGDPSVDALLSQVSSLDKRAFGFTELLRVWANVTTCAENLRVSLDDLHQAFQAASEHEGDAAARPTLGGLHRRVAKQLAVHEANLARAASWVSAALAAHMPAAEQAALPLAHAESSVRGAHKACQERGALWAALVQQQREMQKKRESFRVLSPDGGESASRSEGLQRLRSDIATTEEQVLSLRADVDAAGKVKDSEMEMLTTDVQRMVPVAVQQVAQANAALCEDAAKHWDAVAKRLGGKLTPM